MFFEKRPRMLWGLAVGVLAATLTLSACSGRKSAAVDPFETLRTTMEAEVHGTERLEKMQGLAREMESVAKELLQLIAEEQEDLGALVGDYSSTESDFEKLFADYLDSRYSLVANYLTLRLELKEAATAEEWEKIAKAESEAVKQAAQQILNPSIGDRE